MNQINVLNHGSVRLVDHMGDDLSIVRSARVSYDADWRDNDALPTIGQKQPEPGVNLKGDAKLIDYLVKNRHTSPLESVVFTFEVKAPIFVFRQWHRHRTWSFNEVSARYSELPREYYIPEISQITTQSKSNKQMRTDVEHPQADWAQTLILSQCESAFNAYDKLLASGVPRELARGVLPVNTFSRMFATVNLHNLAHFLKLRLHEHSQYEIRVYAQAMLELIEPLVPVAVTALKKHVLV